MKRMLMFVIYLLVMISFVACGTQDTNSSNGETEDERIQLSEQTDVPYTLIVSKDSPVVIQERIEQLKMGSASEIMTIEEFDYILITMGEQPTGGYEVMIHQVVETKEEVRVWYEIITPGKDDVVTEAITNPYVIVKIAHTENPIVIKKVEGPKL